MEVTAGDKMSSFIVKDTAQIVIAISIEIAFLKSGHQTVICWFWRFESFLLFGEFGLSTILGYGLLIGLLMDC